MTTLANDRGNARRRTLTGLVAAVLLTAVIAPMSTSASAASPALTAVCAAAIPLNLSPGLRLLQSTQGTNRSLGETGTLSCVGNLDGFPVTGPGTIGFAGAYAGTCAAASGAGTWSFSLPVSDRGVTRVIHHSGTYTAPNVGVAIVFTGLFQTGRLAGAGAVVALHGECVTQPITRASLPMLGVQLTQ
ncbi:MAG: hypothetical protein DLM57_00350 [Pseudonocardiales bacterium]|nr:MAG: hypothetical protein DLM57_00350 [Pseudonocardiales bacterium]